MGMYERVRNFVGQRTQRDTAMLDAFLRDAGSSTQSTYGEVFQKKSRLYADLPQMLSDPVISSAIAVVMETAFQPAADTNMFKVTSPYSKIKEELDAFHADYDFDSTMLTLAYNLLVYGNMPIKVDFTPGMSFERYRMIPDFRRVTPIIVSNRTLGFMYDGDFHDSYNFVYAQLLHYKDLGGPASRVGHRGMEKLEAEDKIDNEFTLAPSYLSPASRPWRNIRIIEDALLLQRLDVSNYLRIIGVNVGENAFSKNAIKLLNFYRQIFKKVRRVSFDGDGMSSSSIGNEFEVIVPTTSSQSVDVKDIGGQGDVRALRDLEIQYKRLFSALKLQASFTGFSEDVPSSMGESGASQRWDERFARLVKSVRLSTFKPMKKIDTLFLRSRGYDVDETFFNYTSVAASTIEDEERRKTLETYVGAIGKMIDVLGSTGVQYNKDYVVKGLFADALASTSVDVDQLFSKDAEKLTALVKSSPSAVFKKDKKRSLGVFQALGVLTSEDVAAELKNYSLITSGKDGLGLDGQDAIKSAVSERPALSYQQYLSLGDQLSQKRTVTLEGHVEVKEFDPGSMRVIHSNVGMPTDLKLMTGNLTVKAEDLSSGSQAAIGDLYLVDGHYYLSGQDLYDYLYMVDQGVKKVSVNRVWGEK